FTPRGTRTRFEARVTWLGLDGVVAVIHGAGAAIVRARRVTARWLRVLDFEHLEIESVGSVIHGSTSIPSLGARCRDDGLLGTVRPSPRPVLESSIAISSQA